MPLVSIECMNGEIYEGKVLSEYLTHIIIEDHEFGIFELDVQQITNITPM